MFYQTETCTGYKIWINLQNRNALHVNQPALQTITIAHQKAQSYIEGILPKGPYLQA